MGLIICSMSNLKTPSISERFESLLSQLLTASIQCYSDRLVSLAMFGSVGRGTPRPDSDMDVFLVAEGLPDGRVRRMAEFDRVEASMKPALAQARTAGLTTELSPVIRTPSEVLHGSPLMLDMTEDCRLLYDRNGFLRSALEQFKARLDRLGARRIWRGDAWFWDLNPGYKPGDVFDL